MVSLLVSCNVYGSTAFRLYVTDGQHPSDRNLVVEIVCRGPMKINLNKDR